MNRTKVFLTSLLTFVALYLLKYPFKLLGLVPIPSILITFIRFVADVLVIALLFKLLFAKFASKQYAFSLYLPLGLVIRLCLLPLSLIQNMDAAYVVSLIIDNDPFILLKILHFLARLLLIYYFVSILTDTAVLEDANEKTQSTSKLTKFFVLILTFFCKFFAISVIKSYLAGNAVRVIAFILLVALIVFAFCSIAAQWYVDNAEEEVKGWHACSECKGRSWVVNDFGWKITCPTCDGLGYFYY